MTTRKLAALLMALAMLLQAIPALAEEGALITKDPVTFTAFVQYEASNLTDWNDKEFYKQMGKETNIYFDFTTLNDWSTQAKMALASGETPDIFMSYVSGTDENLDMFWDLTDLIPVYAPSLQALYEREPAIYAGAKQADGRIYHLYAGTTWKMEDAIGNIFWINQKWLDNVGLQNPTTQEELLEVLIAFRDQDANGNGDPTDEIPFGFSENYWAGSMGNMFGFYNVMYNDTYIHLAEDGSLVFDPAQEGYFEVLKWLNTLSQEGLLDKEGFSQTSTQFKSMISNDKYGICPCFSAASYNADFVPMNPVTNAEGKMLMDGSVSPISRKKIAISKTCETPELILQYYEYINSDRTRKLTERYGEEGVFWNYTDETRTDYVHKDLGGMEGLPEGYEYWDQYIYSHGGTGYDCFNFMSMVETNADKSELSVRDQAVKELLPYFPAEKYTEAPLPEEEASEKKMIKNELDAYITNFVATSIYSGITKEQWEQHLKTLQQLQVDRFMELSNQARQAYLDLM